MPVTRKEPLQDQGELFVDFSGLEEVRSAALIEGNPADAPIEPHILMLNALDKLRAVSQLDGYVTMGSRDQVPGDVLNAQRVEAAKKKRGDEAVSSQTFFHQALDLLKARHTTDEELKELGIDSFSTFMKNYYGSHKHTENVAFAKLIKQEALRLRADPDISVSMANRTKGLRPHKARKIPKDPELLRLDTMGRLEALQNDPRAGFLPATHNEKNQVMAFLDYLDNPEYPLGINNQFFEIANHQEREKTKQRGAIPGGVRSVESIVHEFGDYFTQSAKQLAALRDLETKIAECPNPHVTLAEEIGKQHPAYGAFTRFVDLSTLRDKGEVEYGIEYPLRTKEDRWAEGNDPGKHKVVYDQYTAQKTDVVFDVRIQVVTGLLRIGTARKLIREAVVDQTNRHKFMAKRLREATQISYSPKYAPKWVHVAEALLKDQEPVLV